jgi:RecA/RadA recombinase
LDDVLNRIQQKWGQSAIQPAHRIQRIERKTIATGFIALDKMMVGIPCGHITEISGRPTSGMSTLAYHLIASAQSANQHVVCVDMGSSFHGDYRRPVA